MTADAKPDPFRTARERIRWLAHNVIAHPIAGVFWAAGLDVAGDRVHGWWAT